MGNLEKENFASFLNEFYDIFSHDVRGIVNLGNIIINMKDFSPIKQVPRIPLQMRKEVDKIIIKRQEVIEEFSPWISLIILVKKKDGTIKFCALSQN